MSQPQESPPPQASASPVATVVGLLARGAALHMAVGAGTVAWDWWRQQRRRAVQVVPAPARDVVSSLPFARR